jgi:hypothetical protein
MAPALLIDVSPARVPCTMQFCDWKLRDAHDFLDPKHPGEKENKASFPIAIEAIEFKCCEFRFDSSLVKRIIRFPIDYLETVLPTPPPRVRQVTVFDQRIMHAAEK